MMISIMFSAQHSIPMPPPHLIGIAAIDIVS